MQPYVTFDMSLSPVVIITFTGNEPTEENFQAYLDETLHLYDHKEPLSIVFDATQAPLPGLKYQKMQADWLKRHEQLMKNYCRGTAYVIPNALVRGILKAIFALQKQPVPYEIFPRREEGIRWAEDQLEKTSS
ncbi:MAG: STAS/SEC14 domain-containing protein [Cyclobacteriaceae bacterium]